MNGSIELRSVNLGRGVNKRSKQFVRYRDVINSRVRDYRRATTLPEKQQIIREIREHFGVFRDQNNVEMSPQKIRATIGQAIRDQIRNAVPQVPTPTVASTKGIVVPPPPYQRPPPDIVSIRNISLLQDVAVQYQILRRCIDAASGVGFGVDSACLATSPHLVDLRSYVYRALIEEK